MNAPQAIFGGLALIAAAVLIGQTGSLKAQTSPPPTAGRYQLVPFPNVWLGRMDTQTGAVSFCVSANNMGTPTCTPWSKP